MITPKFISLVWTFLLNLIFICPTSYYLSSLKYFTDISSRMLECPLFKMKPSTTQLPKPGMFWSSLTPSFILFHYIQSICEYYLFKCLSLFLRLHWSHIITILCLGWFSGVLAPLWPPPMHFLWTATGSYKNLGHMLCLCLGSLLVNLTLIKNLKLLNKAPNPFKIWTPAITSLAQ